MWPETSWHTWGKWNAVNTWVNWGLWTRGETRGWFRSRRSVFVWLTCVTLEVVQWPTFVSRKWGVDEQVCDCQSQQCVEESPARTMSTDRNAVRSTARPAVRKRNSLYERGRKMLGWLRGELHPLEHSYLLILCLFVSVLSLTCVLHELR